MLRRLEKGLNSAKAKQPASALLSQPSSSAAQFTQPDGAGPSTFAGSASSQQYDDAMDDDEDDRPEEALYPEKVIRSSRSSFLDVVMNPEPPAPDHTRPISGASSERAHSIPKFTSQSPTRSQASPQPRPYTGLFNGYVPKDPVAAGIIQETQVDHFFDMFFLRLNPFINLFDPSLHSPAYIRRLSPFLFTAILMACCKFFCANLYPAVRRLAEEWCVFTFQEGTESVETVQALACMTYWKEPADRRTWMYIGMACRMAVNLRLNKYVGRRQPHETTLAFLERRNRERTYLVLFVHDRSLSMQTGKQWMLHEDELVRHSGTWHEDGCMGSRGEVRPEDVIVAAFVQLRLIGSKATDVFYSRSSGASPPYSPDISMDRDLHDFNSSLDEWFKVWQEQLRQCSQAGGFHSAFIQFFQSHVRLFLNSFGLNLSSLEGRSSPNPEAVRQCYHSACTNLQIISDFDKLHVLQYSQESITVMTAYAAIVLLKLLRAPNVMSQLTEGAVEQIHRIINNAADAYQHAGHVTGSEIDSAAYHARFLRRLVTTDMERARQHAEHGSYRQDGVVPPLFAQGLPPIRTAQTSSSMQTASQDIFSMQRPVPSHSHFSAALPSMSMPGPSTSAYPISAGYMAHPSGGSAMDASRHGLSHTRSTAAYPPAQAASESDDSYWNYMLSEVREAGHTLFARGDVSPTGGVGFMAAGPMDDFSFPSAQYREPSQQYAPGYGGQPQGRSGPSHPYVPPVQAFGGHAAYDMSR
ncbi:hypothetical protein BN946_scf184636.g19 [Trametes cinnabarina]|uniref:Xylanolytic transcriptional activator regulatory domain-containing protein n=1 Tax=Pycnoporus cinnabarinus TaxID=5643 RepID=A0A060S8K6_PYCCI|nr:hypothetical protein BN946_scf184636.g19 [Trametes cinnabarina]